MKHTVNNSKLKLCASIGALALLVVACPFDRPIGGAMAGTPGTIYVNVKSDQDIPLANIIVLSQNGDILPQARTDVNGNAVLDKVVIEGWGRVTAEDDVYADHGSAFESQTLPIHYDGEIIKFVLHPVGTSTTTIP